MDDIKTIIFDLGNVLLDFNHHIASLRLAHYTRESPQEIYELFFDSQLTADFEKGQISPEAFYRGVMDKLKLNIGFNEFLPIWNEIFFFSEKNLEVYNLARKLKENYRLALLSNINILHLDYIKETFPILDAFHDILTSCQMHLRKPDPQIYQQTLKTMHSLPQNTFYTDDRPELVDSAQSLGIKSFVFTDAKSLKSRLEELGVRIT